MDEHSNVRAMRRFYDAFASRDSVALSEILAEATFHVPGRNLIAGTYRGAQEILGLFSKARELTGGTLAFHVHDVIGDDGHVVGLDRVTAERGDRTIDLNRIVIGHATDGALTEIWLNVEDQYGFDEFWS